MKSYSGSKINRLFLNFFIYVRILHQWQLTILIKSHFIVKENQNKEKIFLML